MRSANSASEVADLARVHDGDRKRLGGEACHERDLVATGGLEHNQGRRETGQARAEPRHAVPVVRHVESLTGEEDVDVEPALRDVDADEDRRCGAMFHGPSLRMRARRAAAQATVRVLGSDSGRGPALTCGLSHPRA